jgi:predicted glycosyltransferase
MSARADVLLYVQHLLGIGHLRRAAAIAKAMSAAGLRVVFVTGGPPAPDLDTGGAEMVQLPPLMSADEAFSALVDVEGRPVDEAWKARRAERLLAAYRSARPRTLLIEMFPFGRRQLRFELLPLLEAARAETERPLIVSSVRDILNAQRKPEKTAWILATLERYFDRVLVHGDPALVPFEATFPEAAGLTVPLDYTGYVCSGPTSGAEGPSRGQDGEGEVLVSAGGGRVAGHLIEAALAARALGPLANVPWRILVGHAMPEAERRGFAAVAPEGVAVEGSRPDFQALLSRCRLSISQAGYNTVMEVLQAGVPAVVVPFAAGAETEQSLRAGLLAGRGLLTVVEESGLSARALDRGIRRALSEDRRAARDGLRIRTDGADKTARIVARLLGIVPS